MLRPAWADRFRPPSAEQLLAGVAAPWRPLVAAMRDRLKKDARARESLAWLGTWQWTMVFHQGAGGGVAWVYVIPDPQRPQVCVPVPDVALAGLAAGTLSRAMRETLSRAPTVDGVRWATWEVQNRTQMESLASLAVAVAGPAGTMR